MSKRYDGIAGRWVLRDRTTLKISVEMFDRPNAIRRILMWEYDKQ